MFGRRKSPDRPDGEPTPPSGRVRPEASVLDELSRAFGVADPDGADDNAMLLADGDLDLEVDFDVDRLDTEQSEPFDLTIITSDEIGGESSAASARRRTIRIGDDFDDRPIEAVESPGRSAPSARTSGGPRGGAPGSDDRRDGAAASGRRGPESPGTSTIVIGGDDDLPDAVYLDGGLDDDSGTVFIDDDGTGDALATQDATGRGIEPRLRQRRISVRRAASRKRIKWAVLGLVGVFGVLVVLTVLGSGWFAIDDVDVTGAVYTDEERLTEIVDDLRGTPALLVDTEAAQRQLEAIPWVDSARVRVQFPDSATIEIRERTPVATVAGTDGRFRVLDDEGRVLDVIDGQPIAFVLLGGPSTLNLAAGEFAPLGQAAAASLVTKLTPTIRPRVVSIDVTDDGSDLVMYLGAPQSTDQNASIRVRFGSAIGDNDQIEKLVRLEDTLTEIGSDRVTEINVSTNEVTTL